MPTVIDTSHLTPRQNIGEALGTLSGAGLKMLLKLFLEGKIGQVPTGKSTLQLPGGAKATPGPGLQSQLDAGQLPALTQAGQFPQGTTASPQTRLGILPDLSRPLQQAQLTQANQSIANAPLEAEKLREDVQRLKSQSDLESQKFNFEIRKTAVENASRVLQEGVIKPEQYEDFLAKNEKYLRSKAGEVSAEVASPELNQSRVRSFNALSDEAKRNFLSQARTTNDVETLAFLEANKDQLGLPASARAGGQSLSGLPQRLMLRALLAPFSPVQTPMEQAAPQLPDLLRLLRGQ